MPTEYTLSPSAERIDSETIQRFRQFRTRHAELRDNYRDYVGQERIAVNTFEKTSNGVRSGGEYIPRHRLKGLSMDYRVFHQQDEPTHFKSIINKMDRYFADSPARRAIAHARSTWSSIPIVDWHGLPFDDLCDQVFNSKFFHSDSAKKEKLQHTMERFDWGTIERLLLYGVRWRLFAIQNVSFLLADCTVDYQYMRVPKRFSD
ncbi:hypothetical protein [Sagittula salina]|uniref:Uncharacterized protein n=1 Tax=Sagittula salina TaxID=2820268 RepID=A0A940MNQ2_9RHOB|nr:hypothetical protein [Sagittula salina]MBP0481981.1 hypothetical protein [Sagittula salina]